MHSAGCQVTDMQLACAAVWWTCVARREVACLPRTRPVQRSGGLMQQQQRVGQLRQLILHVHVPAVVVVERNVAQLGMHSLGPPSAPSTAAHHQRASIT